MSEDIGTKIKETRIERGLSASELARMAGISQPYLSQLETGTVNNPSLKVIRKIAIQLNEDYYFLASLAGYSIPNIEDADPKKEIEALKKENELLKNKLKQIQKILKEIDQI